MRLLINATPAKHGGAKAIVENYLRNGDFSAYEEVILLAPKGTKFQHEKICHIELVTNGLFSWFYSFLGILYFALKYKCEKIISFNNINIIVSSYERFTYFHNFHILNGNSFKYILLRMTIKYFLKKSTFVFQTEFVEKEFRKVFGSDYVFKVGWCGCEKPKINSAKSILEKKASSYRCLVPIIDNISPEKNFKFLLDNKIFFEKYDIEVVSLGYFTSELRLFNFIGPQSKEDLFQIYNECDFMIMPSLIETVGLPIFEFSSLGKPVLVLKKAYIKGIQDTVGLTPNIILFDEIQFENVLDDICNNYNNYLVDELSHEHPMLKSDWSTFDY
jgi:glycosyltransferase involved in cell wall biosynthesis